MGKFAFHTKGTCSSEILFELESGVIKDVQFVGGCNGNLQGICRLVKDRPAEEIIGMLEGVKCGYKDTSCPDQLARALKTALKKVEAGS